MVQGLDLGGAGWSIRLSFPNSMVLCNKVPLLRVFSLVLKVPTVVCALSRESGVILRNFAIGIKGTIGNNLSSTGYELDTALHAPE